jgi:hypothetical protein
VSELNRTSWANQYKKLLAEQRHLMQKGIRMRLYALVMASAMTGVTLTLLGSPVAQADNASFVRDIQARGFQQASDNLISTGKSACYFLWLNRDPGQIAERIGRYLNVDPDRGRQFLVLAVNEYCPQYSGQVGA